MLKAVSNSVRKYTSPVHESANPIHESTKCIRPKNAAILETPYVTKSE